MLFEESKVNVLPEILIVIWSVMVVPQEFVADKVSVIELPAVADFFRPLPSVVAVAHGQAGILDGQHAV